MQQKKLRYFLIGGVTLVWGLIIYRVIIGLSFNNPLPTINSPIARQISESSDSDNFVLIADYPDPFLSEMDTVETKVSEASNNGSKSAEPINIQPSSTPALQGGYIEGTIQYTGMIANPDQRIKVAAISLKGSDLLLREKDKVEGFTINKIFPDRLEIIFKGKKLVIRKS